MSSSIEQPEAQQLMEPTNIVDHVRPSDSAHQLQSDGDATQPLAFDTNVNMATITKDAKLSGDSPMDKNQEEAPVVQAPISPEVTATIHYGSSGRQSIDATAAIEGQPSGSRPRGQAQASQRSSKRNSAVGRLQGRGPSASKAAQLNQQYLAKGVVGNMASLKDPRQQEHGMGIGPNGTDLSQFFASGFDQRSKIGSREKPQTAGTLAAASSLEHNEFGEQKMTIINAPHGPSITNIGFANQGQLQNLSNNLMSSLQAGNYPCQVGGPGSNQSRAGSFHVTGNDRSKSFNQHRQSRRAGQGFGATEVTVNQKSHGGFSKMKPFIQGSALHRPGEPQAKRPTTQGAQSFNGGARKKSHFPDYNFFSKKLNQNGIPKNQEIKYRKEMQQLKFYQTLNNYPHILEQQKLKQEQQKAFQQQRQSQAMPNPRISQTAGQGQRGGNSSLLRSHQAAQDALPNQAPIQHQRDAMQNPLRESQYTQDRSTKQTVYQMHSSRQKLHGEGTVNLSSLEQQLNIDAPRAPLLGGNQRNLSNIAANDTLANLNVTSTEQIDLQKNSIITAEVAHLSQANQVSYGPTPQPSDEMPPTKEEQSSPQHQATGLKPSVISQETDLQASMYNPSQIEKRAMFDASPKLTDDKAKTLQAKSDQKETNQLVQPMLSGQTKKVVSKEQSSSGACAPLATGQHNQRSLAKPLNSVGTTTTAMRQSQNATSKNDIISTSLVNQPVERVEIKQQTVSASYLAVGDTHKQPIKGIGAHTGAKVLSKFATQAQSRDPLKKQHSETNSGALMIQGNQMKKEQEPVKEINRAQSMKPLVEPLMQKQEDAKTLYWRLNSNMNDDGATVHLEKQPKDTMNADISQGSCIPGTNGFNNLHSQTIPSESMLKNKNVLAGLQVSNGPQQQSQKPGSNQAKSNGVLTGNPFEEQVSGIGVRGLFSVWGPSSQQSKERQQRQGTSGGQQREPKDLAHIYGVGSAINTDPYRGTLQPKRVANTADINKRGQDHNLKGVGFGLEGVEPSNMAHHMQLVNSIINDGSLQNLVFSNGSLTTEYLQQNKSQVAKLITGSPFKGGSTENGGPLNFGEDEDGSQVEQDDSDEDEHIIVTMLRSMNSKKLETCQLKDMKLEIDIEKIRTEIKLEFFKEMQKKHDTKIEAEWQLKLAKFDRLFNKIVVHKLKLDQENAFVKKLEEQAIRNEERLKNPFYMTLKAQKEERDKFIDFYQSGLLLGLPASTSDTGTGKVTNVDMVSLNQTNRQPFEAIEGDSGPDQADLDGGAGDLFKQTAVDIEDEPSAKFQKDSRNQKILGTSSRQNSDSFMASSPRIERTIRMREDLFCFYRLQTEIPKTFFDKLGDQRALTKEAVQSIALYIQSEWPSLGRRKRMTYRSGFDSTTNVVNCVPLGKEAPLSKCCMRNVIFVFPCAVDIRGHVQCSDPFCAKNKLDSFAMTEQLIHAIFVSGLKLDQPYYDNQSGATGEGQSSFMDQRRRMQGSSSLKGLGGLGQRFQNAASYEISKKISAGNYKTCKLEQVITHPKFQKQHLSSGRLYEASELVDRILNVNHGPSSKGGVGSALTSKAGTNFRNELSITRSLKQDSIFNENQMLADLIQNQAIKKHKHKATLPVSKLVQHIPKQATFDRNGYANASYLSGSNVVMASQLQKLSSQPGRYHPRGGALFPYGSQPVSAMNYRTNTSADQVQMLDSMFQASNQLHFSGDQAASAHQQMLPKLEKNNTILYQDNQQPQQQQLTTNADINYLKTSPHIEAGLASARDDHGKGRNFSSLVNAQGGKNSQEFDVEKQLNNGQHRTSYGANGLTGREGDDSNTVGVTMQTAGGLDDAKYSHSKSPINITGALTKDSQGSAPNSQRLEPKPSLKLN